MAISRWRRKCTRSTRDSLRTARASSGSPSSSWRSESGALKRTSAWRPCSSTASAWRSRPGVRQVSENSALRMESCLLGARPQRIVTGTICTSAAGSPMAARTMSTSSGEWP